MMMMLLVAAEMLRDAGEVPQLDGFVYTEQLCAPETKGNHALAQSAFPTFNSPR